MLNLKLRDEFLGAHMPGTAISLRTSDHQGAAQKNPDYILSITYPTADIQTALKAISQNRSGRPIVLMGGRGRGKSHIMAVMHHTIETPDVVEDWLHMWGEKLDDNNMKNFKSIEGYFAISEPVHNHEYPLLWNLLFDCHPKGEYYRGKFEQMSQSYPPRTLLEEMFENQPTCLILDEFQTWFTGLPEKDPKNGIMVRQWAYNFIQNLSEIARDRPEILILVISVLDNQNEAFKQVHRQGPIVIDFRGQTAKQDRKKLLLHRLFENRENISDEDIHSIADVYASERFRLLYPNKSDTEKEQIRLEAFECWPFSPELLELLDDHILLSQAAQETRDMIRILAQVYRSRGEKSPIITPADFYIDSDSEEVQTLIDSIAVQAGQEKLREIARRNLENIKEAGVDVPDARELVSAIWMCSMSPSKNAGGTPAELHLDITSQQVIDDNAFQAEITLLKENSVNIHGGEVAGETLRFELNENPRSKVRSFAKNDKLWQSGVSTASGQIVYPGKDIDHIRKTLRDIFEPKNQQPTSRVIILGPNWKNDPWGEVIEEADKPEKWNQPILMVIPEQIEGSNVQINSTLGEWLVKNVPARRNTIRFLLLASEEKGLYNDRDLTHYARCSYLCGPEAWGKDTTYHSLHQDFDRGLRGYLKKRFNRFAILQKWDYQNPENCVFHLEKLSEQGGEIPTGVESKIRSDLFDQTDFQTFVFQRAKDSDFIGSLMDDLTNPPPPNTGEEAIPFLGQTKIFELILSIASQGDIVLNVNGTYIGRRAEDTSDDDALRFIRSKAYRTGQEMRQIQLHLPDVVGGKPIALDKQNKQTASITTTGTRTDGDVQVEVGSGEYEGEKNVNGIAEELTGLVQTKLIDEPTTGINLSGYFEKWGISSTQTIESTKIDFDGLTVQQIKQILQRIPSNIKARLEITFKEGDKE